MCLFNLAHTSTILIAELTQKGSLVPSQYSVISNTNIVTPLVKKGIYYGVKKYNCQNTFFMQS